MQFSNTTYSRLKSRIKRRYRSEYLKSIKTLKTYPQSKTSKWIKNHHSEFSEFSPQRWFFLQQVETLLFFLSQKNQTSKVDVFSEQDDEIFEKWNHSEFADSILQGEIKRIRFKQCRRMGMSLHISRSFGLSAMVFQALKYSSR